jgi:SagB-type dehydrogenase family enzyme
MLSPWDDVAGPERADEPDGAEYCWAAVAFHTMSSFGQFIEPQAPSPEPAVGERPAYARQETVPTQDALAIPECFKASLAEAIGTRISRREFGRRSIPQAKLRAILWAAYGQLQHSAEGERRTVPSAGALYPLRLLVLAQSVEGMDRSIFEYQSETGGLKLCPELSPPASPSSWFRTKHVAYENASAVIFLVGGFDGICRKYGERGYRYLLLEAGHVAQNICLAATITGIQHVPVGGFDDDTVNEGLGLDQRREAVVYSLVMGCI